MCLTVPLDRYTGVIPDVDYIVDAYFHAHREMVDDMWLIHATPGRLGL